MPAAIYELNCRLIFFGKEVLVVDPRDRLFEWVCEQLHQYKIYWTMSSLRYISD